MRLFVVLLLTSIPFSHADETFEISPFDAVLAANAYAHAADLPTLNAAGGFELRIWMNDYMFGSVSGIVVSNGTRRSFDSISSYDQGQITIKAAPLSHAKAPTNISAVKALVLALEPYDQAFISCGVIDGGSILVDATLQGHRITFEANNPGFCKDKASKIVVKLLRQLSETK